MSWICQVSGFHVFAYQIRCLIFEFFTYSFYCRRKLLPVFFLVSWFNFYCHYYFHYLCFLPYKKPTFDFCQPSTKKIKSTISINNNGTFTEHTWATSAKNRRKLSMRKSWDLLLLKWVYGIFWNLSVNLFCVFQRGTVKNVVWILS